MAFTQNYNRNVFGPNPWVMLGPIADRPAEAETNSVYITTDEGGGIWKVYLYTSTGWVQCKGIAGITTEGGGGDDNKIGTAKVGTAKVSQGGTK